MGVLKWVLGNVGNWLSSGVKGGKSSSCDSNNNLFIFINNSNLGNLAIWVSDGKSTLFIYISGSKLGKLIVWVVNSKLFTYISSAKLVRFIMNNRDTIFFVCNVLLWCNRILFGIHSGGIVFSGNAWVWCYRVLAGIFSGEIIFFGIPRMFTLNLELPSPPSSPPPLPSGSKEVVKEAVNVSVGDSPTSIAAASMKTQVGSSSSGSPVSPVTSFESPSSIAASSMKVRVGDSVGVSPSTPTPPDAPSSGYASKRESPTHAWVIPWLSSFDPVTERCTYNPHDISRWEVSDTMVCPKCGMRCSLKGCKRAACGLLGSCCSVS